MQHRGVTLDRDRRVRWHARRALHIDECAATAAGNQFPVRVLLRQQEAIDIKAFFLANVRLWPSFGAFFLGEVSNAVVLRYKLKRVEGACRI